MAGTTTTVTRQELATYVQGLFLEDALIDRDDIVRKLEANGAPAAAVELIESRVPEDARMANLRAVWQYLPDVPVA